jgi:hypothetical protein
MHIPSSDHSDGGRPIAQWMSSSTPRSPFTAEVYQKNEPRFIIIAALRYVEISVD